MKPEFMATIGYIVGAVCALTACSTDELRFAQKVGANKYVLMTIPTSAPDDGRAYEIAHGKAQVFCEKAGEPPPVSILDDENPTVIERGQEMDVIYFSCGERP